MNKKINILNIFQLLKTKTKEKMSSTLCEISVSDFNSFISLCEISVIKVGAVGSDTCIKITRDAVMKIMLEIMLEITRNAIDQRNGKVNINHKNWIGSSRFEMIDEDYGVGYICVVFSSKYDHKDWNCEKQYKLEIGIEK